MAFPFLAPLAPYVLPVVNGVKNLAQGYGNIAKLATSKTGMDPIAAKFTRDAIAAVSAGELFTETPAEMQQRAYNEQVVNEYKNSQITQSDIANLLKTQAPLQSPMSFNEYITQQRQQQLRR